MRLLNAATLKAEEFFGDDMPKYAILSHRWEKEEITLRDLLSGAGVSMAGYSKIIGCCAQAIADGWQYVWVDSCCIDKSSSAELSEAINSMFKWYRNAQICYVYLSDVPSGDATSLDPLNPDSTGSSKFCRSKWFTRGWTLQELLAPIAVEFYDQEWISIGTRTYLERLISSVTGIQDFANFQTACVAQKMSWASQRETTRVEDSAYCLMGIFGVNMPPLYGEGENAFLRLQLEILSKSDDESIFAWTDERSHFGMLARSLSAFKNSGDVETGAISKILKRERLPYSMTNKGLRMEHYFVRSQKLETPGSLSVLNCRRKGTDNYLAIFLPITQDGFAFRGYVGELFELNLLVEERNITRMTVYIKQRGGNPESFSSKRDEIIINLKPLLLGGFKLTNYYFVSVLNEWKKGCGELREQLLIGRGPKAAVEFMDNYGCVQVFVLISGSRKTWIPKVMILESKRRVEECLFRFEEILLNLPYDDDNQMKTLSSGTIVSVIAKSDSMSVPGKLIHNVNFGLLRPDARDSSG